MKFYIHFLIIFFAIPGFGQGHEKYNSFMHFTIEKGLSQNAIMDITKDDLGFMWIATKNGINRFDGERFYIFQKIENDTLSLSNNHILSIENDKDGSIWIGTMAGINKYDPNTQKIHRLKVGEINAPNKRLKIMTICRMSNGNVWFGSNQGLIIFDRVQNVFSKVSSYSKGLGGIGNGIKKIFQDSNNTIWIGTDKNLYKIVPNDIHNLHLSKIATAKGFKDIFVQEIIEGPDDKIYVGTLHNGVLVYDSSNEVLQKHKYNDLLGKDVRCLQFDRDQSLWVGSFSGLAIMQQNETIRYPEYLTEDGEEINDGLKSFYLDHQGSVWMGGYSGGIKIWNPAFSIIKSFKTLKPELDINLGLVNTMAEDASGVIYLGTKKRGIAVIKKDKSIDYDLTEYFTTTLSEITIKALLIDSNFLWIGTRAAGLKVFDLRTKKFVPDKVSDALQNLFRKAKIYSIAKSGDVLAIGTFGGGLILYDIKTQKHYDFYSDVFIPSGSLGNIRVVYFDKQHNLWIGSVAGLKRIRAEEFGKAKIQIEKVKLSDEEEFGDIAVMSISENHIGQIMIGTSSDGFFMEKNGLMEKQDILISGEPVNLILGAVEDKRKQIWLSTDQGIIQYNPLTKKSIVFDKNYGLTNSEFRNQSFLKASEKYIYLGTTAGTVYFDPDELKSMDPSSKVMLTDFTIRSKKHDTISEKRNYKKNTFAINKQLELAYHENSFTIYFSAFNFTKNRNTIYEYRLLGLNEQWKSTSNPEVTYTLQKSGTYEFQVRKKGGLGQGADNKIARLSLYLQTAPWKSWYAYTAYAMLFLAGIFGVYRFLQSKTELEHQLELENIEKNKHKSQIEFFTNLSHDFRTPLTLILAPLYQLIEKYEGSNSMYRKLMGIRRNADQLLQLVNQLLDFSKIEETTNELNIESANIVQCVREVYVSFEEYAKMGEYTYTFQTSSDYIQLHYDSLLVQRVFYNLISNAFKNTPRGGNIQVLIKETESTVSIAVEDSGKGIDIDYVNNVFKRFYQVAESPKFKENFAPGTGIGLHIAKRTIDLHKGTILVESSGGKGATFKVELRKDAHHLTSSENQKKISRSEKDVGNHIALLETDEKEMNSFFIDFDETENQSTILIVEDNDELRKFLVDILKGNYRIEQAADGRKAYNKALQKNIDLVISDIMMPGITGTELSYKLKNNKNTSHIPIILLSSRSSLPHKIKGLESGADAYITKPFVVKEFLLIVKNLLGTFRESKEKNTVNKTDFYQNILNSDDEVLFKKAMQIIHRNINNSSFEINMFSSELGISRSKLFKKIKSWTGQTPKEFLQSIRLQKASELLEMGELNVSDICYEVGFASPNYFARCFKKQFHQTPTEYASKFYKD